jgi:hypothetical protein
METIEKKVVLTVYSRERGYRKLKEGVSFETYKAKYPSAIKAKLPSYGVMEKWNFDGVARTPDGCKVEPDGDCPHGYPSWLKVIGII